MLEIWPGPTYPIFPELVASGGDGIGNCCGLDDVFCLGWAGSTLLLPGGGMVDEWVLIEGILEWMPGLFQRKS